MSKKITFDEAFEAMMNLHKVFESVGKESFSDIPAGNIRFLLMSGQIMKETNVPSLKNIKEIIVSKHSIKDKKEIAQLETKISKIFKCLSDSGLVELHPSKHDARVKEVTITEKGQVMTEKFIDLARKKWEEINNA